MPSEPSEDTPKIKKLHMHEKKIKKLALSLPQPPQPSAAFREIRKYRDVLHRLAHVSSYFTNKMRRVYNALLNKCVICVKNMCFLRMFRHCSPKNTYFHHFLNALTMFSVEYV